MVVLLPLHGAESFCFRVVVGKIVLKEAGRREAKDAGNLYAAFVRDAADNTETAVAAGDLSPFLCVTSCCGWKCAEYNNCCCGWLPRPFCRGRQGWFRPRARGPSSGGVIAAGVQLFHHKPGGAFAVGGKLALPCAVARGPAETIVLSSSRVASSGLPSKISCTRICSASSW